MSKFSNIKKDFPIFKRDINGNKLTYLDSGATSQKPNSVIEKMTDIYKFNNANVHRGTYVLSSETTSEYESVRYKLQSFLQDYQNIEDSGLVGVILPYITNRFYPEVLTELHEALRLSGFRILLITTDDGEELDDKLIQPYLKERLVAIISATKKSVQKLCMT